jgi:hypothetical protein
VVAADVPLSLPDSELLARWKPAARARDVVGFASARWAAVAMAAACGTPSVRSVVDAGLWPPPTRDRRSGLDAKYLVREQEPASVRGVNRNDVEPTHSSRREKNASFSFEGRLANGMVGRFIRILARPEPSYMPRINESKLCQQLSTKSSKIVSYTT